MVPKPTTSLSTKQSTAFLQLVCLTRLLQVKVKVNVGFFYSATYSGNAATSRAVQSQEMAVDWQEPMVLQLQQTPPPQSTTPGLHPVSIHQMAPPVRGSKHPITAYYSVYRPRKDEKLNRPALSSCAFFLDLVPSACYIFSVTLSGNKK